MKSKRKRSSSLVWREVDGEIAIISSDNKLLHTLNGVGSRIWELLDGENDLATIASVIISKYGEREAVVKTDLAEYIEDLERLNLLEV